ncbi:hypothetical protein CMUST_10440 [Corynebacterium mustelae]|uniref:Uncharacterized protein n=1 Tax=Corynebacterium mustelae TaxID=571915 RepID=A0A0G3GZ11_9CORY|nr:hypothetical protein [Corynebacterium mustelae]AKK06404.1 hypothetical protein CMUST_10440 [Corynebacterium mustelae]
MSVAATPTTRTLPSAQLVPANLSLALVESSDINPDERSTDGYHSVPAEVALAATLRAQFRCGATVLSHEGLAAMNLTTRQAWNRAATNMIALECDEHGVAVRTRPSTFLSNHKTPGLQVDFCHSSPTAWLAHPHTFNTLYRHLCKLIGDEVCFYLPTTDILLAIGLTESRVEIESWLSATEMFRATSAHRVYYRSGFPSTRPPAYQPASPITATATVKRRKAKAVLRQAA